MLQPCGENAGARCIIYNYINIMGADRGGEQRVLLVGRDMVRLRGGAEGWCGYGAFAA